MCQHHALPPANRRALALEHGRDHDRDHALWNRRDFLVRSGLATVSGAMMLGATPVHALSRAPLLEHLLRLPTDRVLVLIQLAGGNDGLNTVVPVTNDLYYQQRPNLAIAPENTIAAGGDYGFHTSLDALTPFWNEGDMAVVHSVGYPDPNLSHFRSTDIWATASDSQEVLSTGWAGRTLDAEFPDFAAAPPAFPPAVQIGTALPTLFQGSEAGMAMSLVNVDQFLSLVSGGTPYDPAAVPATPYGQELAYARTVANDSFRYLDAIQAAADGGTNAVSYPEGHMPASLAACARLIKGNLGSRIYLVTLGSFDTHSDQKVRQSGLLATLSEAVAAFYSDLAATGHDERVLTMTFSEFGRRVQENSSNGTDHGTAAPLFVFGKRITGGFYGEGPDLGTLDSNGNLLHSTDFRSIYATVLKRWFGLSPAVVDDILGGSFSGLRLLGTPVDAAATAPFGFGLEQNTPNPFQTSTRLTFSLDEAGPTRLRIYDMRGRLVATPVEGTFTVGSHAVTFDAGTLPSGVYLYRLDAPSGTKTQRMTLAR